MSHILQHMKILVIDDNPLFGRIFVKRLKLKGFLVDYATTLRDGLRRFETEQFHVVFIDTPFDMISEKQVLETLQKNDIFNKSSVFLFSSIDINQTDLNEWKTSGLFSYLKKPVKFNEIIKELENVKIDLSYSISKNPPSDDTLSYSDLSVSNSDEKLTQLQNQIRELEQHVEDSTIPDIPSETAPAADTQDSADVAIRQASSTYDDQDDDDEATSEQLEKLTQLQNQIRELEQHVEDSTIPDIPSETAPAADTQDSADVATRQVFSDMKVDSFTEKMTAFQSIITTLKSFNSLDFGTNTSNPIPVRNDDVSKTTIEQEIKDTLSEIDLLRKDLLLLDEASSQDTDGKKKRKITTMSQNNPPKSGKKPSIKKTTKKTRKTTKKTRKTKKLASS
ncbi:response regulator [Nitrosopumilus sp.]|uniref:response regulator n=1 Tax=Nitrosopumilus sp. TaxID=2024843 RepID=UPI003B59EE0B